MTEHMPEELADADAWRDVESRAAELIQAAEAAVVRWRWASSSAGLAHPVPLWSERDGRAPVSRLAETAPADIHRCVAYGFDDQNRIIVSEKVDRDDRLSDATVWIESNCGRVHMTFMRSRGELRLARIAIPEHEGERMLRLRLIFDPREEIGETVETYEHDDAGKLTRIIEDRVATGHFVCGSANRPLRRLRAPPGGA